MTVAKRGMHGYTFEPGTPIMQAAKRYDPDEILAGPGIVDYVVGCEPGPGVWALGTIEHPRQRHYLNLYKLGEGPLYCFYTPYHLCHFEVPVTIARAALLHDAAITPMGAPQLDVLAIAKRDLKAGETIDMLGGYTVYGEAETASDYCPRRAAADRRGGGLQAEARRAEGPGAGLCRRRGPARAAGRQAAGRAGGAVRAARRRPEPPAQAAGPGQSPRRPARRSMCAR